MNSKRSDEDWVGDGPNRLSLSYLDPTSPRTKSDYFKLSQEKGLSKRCPILRRCARRNSTIRLRHHDDGPYMIEPPDPLSPVVEIIEYPTRAGGSSNYHVSNLCPEVALFEAHDSFPVLSGYPMTEGEWDRHMNPPYRILKTGHFSECAEYAVSTVEAPKNKGDEMGDHVMAVLERIAARFPAVVAQLSLRRKGREPLILNDEYDVQYLFQSLLAVEFLDIRPEEMGPSTAGGAMRADCLLKDRKTVIEFKMTRAGYNSPLLCRELAHDFLAYGAHPDCENLFAFIYDPARLIVNPRGVEADLSKPRLPIKRVKTFVQQG